MTKCRVCHQSLDPEHPESIYEVNPQTFLYAWMHPFCYGVALETIGEEPPNDCVNFNSRLDEYYDKVMT